MNMKNRIIRYLICWAYSLIASTSYCQHTSETFLSTVDFTWGKEVIEHYRYSNDEEKFKAAYFLVSSMRGHHSPTSEAIQEYIATVNHCKIPCSQDSLSFYWQEAIKHKKSNTHYTEDTLSLDKEFLISHIEQAFHAWRNAPWYKDICFDDFCHYILPYRVSDEIINRKGRESLVSKYGHLIQGETDIVKAFTVICNTMFERIRQTKPQCPYTPDAHTIDYLQQGNCLQRCVLLTEVLRALGIPCSIDIVPVWANYSRVGHSWVAMPYKKKNYTWRERDSIASSENPIDASRFAVTYRPDSKDNFPYPIEYSKKTAKVYRLCYENNLPKSHKTVSPELFTKRLTDVSQTYGLTDSINFLFPASKDSIYYLCTFRSGIGWTPIARSILSEEKIIFPNVGKDIVYILAKYVRGIVRPCSFPFLLEQTNKYSFFIANGNICFKQRIYRKYPVFSQWTNQWGNMIGGVFEGANISDFSDADTLAIIRNMPFGETGLSVNRNQSYRYVRYHSTNKSRTPLAELSFYDAKQKKLHGVPISHKALQKSKGRVFDGSIATEGFTKQTNYWVGLDLGDSIKTHISHIRFFPKNDGNFVTRGAFYELFYYDEGWHSLGERFSVEDYVEYDVPEGALLWLKCDMGQDERIFTYKKGRQVWY